MATDEEKMGIARDALAALGGGDHEPALSALDENVRVRASGPLWSRRYRGVDGLLDVYRHAQGVLDEFELSIRSVEADDDGSVVVSGNVSGTVDGRGRLTAELLGVLHFRGNAIDRVYLRTRHHELHRDKRRSRRDAAAGDA